MAHNDSSPIFVTTSEGGLKPALVIAAGAVLPILDLIAVALRSWSRRQGKGVGIGVDDWLVLVSAVLTTGLGIMLIIGGSMHALAQPTELRPERLSFLTFAADSLLLTEKIFFAFNLTQCWAFGAAKLSVLFFYRRIFRGSAFNAVSIALNVVVCMWTVGLFFAILFRCGTRFWALWAPLKDLLANCYTSTPMFQAFSITDMVTDLLIIAIPISWASKWTGFRHEQMTDTDQASRLDLPMGRKFALCGVFLDIAAGIVRLVFFVQQSNNYEANEDGIGHLTTEMYWSMIEMGISVIAACVPTTHIVLKSMTPEDVVRSMRSRLTLKSQGSGRPYCKNPRFDEDTRTQRAYQEDIEMPELPR